MRGAQLSAGKVNCLKLKVTYTVEFRSILKSIIDGAVSLYYVGYFNYHPFLSQNPDLAVVRTRTVQTRGEL